MVSKYSLESRKVQYVHLFCVAKMLLSHPLRYFLLFEENIILELNIAEKESLKLGIFLKDSFCRKWRWPLTKTAEECAHCLVLGHVNQPSAQTKMWKYQQHLLHYVVDAGDILLRKMHTNTHTRHKALNINSPGWELASTSPICWLAALNQRGQRRERFGRPWRKCG